MEVDEEEDQGPLPPAFNAFANQGSRPAAGASAGGEPRRPEGFCWTGQTLEGDEADDQPTAMTPAEVEQVVIPQLRFAIEHKLVEQWLEEAVLMRNLLRLPGSPPFGTFRIRGMMTKVRRAIMLLLHPDKRPHAPQTEASELFAVVNAAWEFVKSEIVNKLGFEADKAYDPSELPAYDVYVASQQRHKADRENASRPRKDAGVQPQQGWNFPQQQPAAAPTQDPSSVSGAYDEYVEEWRGSVFRPLSHAIPVPTEYHNGYWVPLRHYKTGPALEAEDARVNRLRVGAPVTLEQTWVDLLEEGVGLLASLIDPDNAMPGVTSLPDLVMSYERMSRQIGRSNMWFLTAQQIWTGMVRNCDGTCAVALAARSVGQEPLGHLPEQRWGLPAPIPTPGAQLRKGKVLVVGDSTLQVWQGKAKHGSCPSRRLNWLKGGEYADTTFKVMGGACAAQIAGAVEEYIHRGQQAPLEGLPPQWARDVPAGDALLRCHDGQRPHAGLEQVGGVPRPDARDQGGLREARSSPRAFRGAVDHDAADGLPALRIRGRVAHAPTRTL